MVRVRFAPSPTGYLHIGGARTALFNWLWARKTSGKFILRIEDTDQSRSTAESEQAILDSMKWLGLDWDEGPFFQMKRLATYEKHAEALIAKGRAFRCDCTKEELDRQRAIASAEKRGFKYPGTCREKNLPKGTPGAVVRFRIDPGAPVEFADLVKGRIVTPRTEMQDEVILRADGVPLYNFGAVVDDIEMQISMVARGDDHVVNTPRQILMYQALDYPLPTFAHLPMILGADKQRLSKRHGAVSVLQYRDDGYLPGALVNYLVRLGWSHGDQEIFSIPELIEKFDWEHVGDTAGVFNPEKLLWLNQQWLKRAPLPELAAMLNIRADYLRPFVERSTTLKQLAEQATHVFVGEPKVELPPEARPMLEEARKLIEAKFDEGPKAMEDAFRARAKELGIKLGPLLGPLRLALTGLEHSPPLFEIIAVLGKERALARLKS